MDKTFRMAVCFLILLTAAFSAKAEPLQENGNWYYRNENGERIKNSFVKIDGHRYYFGTDGSLVTDRPVEAANSRYYCDENGNCLTGKWKKCAYPGEGEETWHYYLGTGKAFENGWLQIGDARYHFSNWSMDWGWYSEETASGRQDVYYLGTEDEGQAAKGWLAWKGAEVPGAEEHPAGWYWFSETGKMICDKEMTIGSRTYAFNGNGTMAVGFCKVESTEGKVKELYYDRRTGCRAEGWQYLSEDGLQDGWYYFKSGAVSVPENCTRKITEEFGVSLIDGYWYGFDGTGRMVTGLTEAGSDLFCFAGDGRMVTGYVNMAQYDPGASSEWMMFSTEGASPPVLGAAVTGISDGFLYKNGCRICAGEAGYEQIELQNGEISQSYVVNVNGSVIKSGIVTLKDGSKRKIVHTEGGWELLEI